MILIYKDFRTTPLFQNTRPTAEFRLIEAYYNRKRKHSTIGYQSPVKFEEDNLNMAA